MPRYFFHVRGEYGFARDREGADFEDLKAAHSEAMASAKEGVAYALMGGQQLGKALCRTIEIEDDAGTVLLSVPFYQAAEAEDHRPMRRRVDSADPGR